WKRWRRRTELQRHTCCATGRLRPVARPVRPPGGAMLPRLPRRPCGKQQLRQPVRAIPHGCRGAEAHLPEGMAACACGSPPAPPAAPAWCEAFMALGGSMAPSRIDHRPLSVPTYIGSAAQRLQKTWTSVGTDSPAAEATITPTLPGP